MTTLSILPVTVAVVILVFFTFVARQKQEYFCHANYYDQILKFYKLKMLMSKKIDE